ncbi:hypothetical protein BGW37DRAFT_507117 [Umbelopsis sp. PMI_123]|nr:hypothetical protein BGW37DRAFT_507117 [Umbelopsis sp. PMI_123]
MIQNSQLPSELLPLIFKYLIHEDLVSCSYTCWSWNDAANVLLYHRVYGFSQSMFEKLITTITPSQSPGSVKSTNIITRQRQLGNLIKVIDMKFHHSYYDFAGWYLPMLSDLAAVTPNVHTADIYEPATCCNTMDNMIFDWEEDLGCKWPYLRNLMIQAPTRYIIHENCLRNMDRVVSRIENLNIMNSKAWNYSFASCSTPLTNLQSLKVAIRQPHEYNIMQQILQSCRNTLHTLAIAWSSVVSYGSGKQLDCLIQELPNLKKFVLLYHSEATFTLESFGDKLDELELVWIDHLYSDQPERTLGKALTKTSNLKTLILSSGLILAEYLPIALAINHVTLQKFCFAGYDGGKLISSLLMNNTRLSKVTTLCFEDRALSNAMIIDLAMIFPHVEFLVLTRGISESHEPWITCEAVSQFKRLKGIDVMTFSSLIDQGKFKNSQYRMKRHCNEFDI